MDNLKTIDTYKKKYASDIADYINGYEGFLKMEDVSNRNSRLNYLSNKLHSNTMLVQLVRLIQARENDVQGAAAWAFLIDWSPAAVYKSLKSLDEPAAPELGPATVTQVGTGSDEIGVSDFKPSEPVKLGEPFKARAFILEAYKANKFYTVTAEDRAPYSRAKLTQVYKAFDFEGKSFAVVSVEKIAGRDDRVIWVAEILAPNVSRVPGPLVLWAGSGSDMVQAIINHEKSEKGILLYVQYIYPFAPGRVVFFSKRDKDLNDLEASVLAYAKENDYILWSY